MLINRMNLSSILTALKNDIGEKRRFNVRVVFTNNLYSYFSLVNGLEELADEILHLSDEKFCSGADVIPNIKKVAAYIKETPHKNLLITSIGEYLRFAESVEKRNQYLLSIINHQAQSGKRVWMPIFCGKDIFQRVVGDLSEERFYDALYELEEDVVDFEAFAFSDSFSNNADITNINGLRAWFALWDDKKVVSGMRFSTGKTNIIKPTDGTYSIHVIQSPFEFISSNLRTPNVKLCEALGTNIQWGRLAAYSIKSKGSCEDIITRALNLVEFDAEQILSSWHNMGENGGFGRWLFWLWYKLDLAKTEDYISYAVKKAETYYDIQQVIENEIIHCIGKVSFDLWIEQRQNALRSMSISDLSDEFWNNFNAITDERAKLKILTANSHAERTQIISIVSTALQNGRSIHDFKSILMDKYPELYVYLNETNYINDASLSSYVRAYKQYKIMDVYDASISEMALNCDVFSFDTRGQLLNAQKFKGNSYYLWVDGMGLEWIDLLLKNVKLLNPEAPMPTVSVGMASMPTITSVNMEKADPDTVSEKFDALDSLSHIKDKSDCNYYSIIDKQFILIKQISEMIAKLLIAYPEKDIVVTADHGMSRMAAKAFHEKEGVKAPNNSEVCSLGRYCTLPEGSLIYDYANTYKEDGTLAYRTHAHFKISGYAPGEIHGGATPEEWLVPVIVYSRSGCGKTAKKPTAKYKLVTNSCNLNFCGEAEIQIETQGEVTTVEVEVDNVRYKALCSGDNKWMVAIPGQTPETTMGVRVFLNNKYSSVIETVMIKRKGIVVDDDF